MDKAAAWLKQSLAYTFEDEHLFRQALTHRSAPGSNNERLEFLGDAVLQLVISEWIFDQTGSSSEGQLSRLRASLVRSKTLATLARELGAGEHVLLGSGEKKSGGHRRASILADTLEALFGAVYLAGGFAAAQRVIRHVYGERLHDLGEFEDLRDPKSRLQEYLQGRGLPVPEYVLDKVSGKAHQQLFHVSCRVPALGLTQSGSGAARKDAEQQAALAVLRSIGQGNE